MLDNQLVKVASIIYIIKYILYRMAYNGVWLGCIPGDYLSEWASTHPRGFTQSHHPWVHTPV